MRPRVRIGRLLLKAGVLDKTQVEEVVAVQHRDGGRFCSVALKLGLADERTLVRTLSRQLGVPGMVVGDVQPEPHGGELVSKEAAFKLCVLPARVFNRTLTLLMRDPTDQSVLNDLQFYSGKVVRPLVALEGPLWVAIRGFYEQVDVQPAPAVDVEPVVAEVPVSPLAPEQIVPLDMAIAPLDLAIEEVVISPPAAAESSESDADDPRPRLLAVDDEPSILRLYEGIFPEEDYQLFTCDNGSEAIARVRAVRPHVILLDALLPGVHGFEICRSIKQSPVIGDTAVILLSAAYRGWQMRTDLMREYGADEFMEKPFGVVQLKEQVDELVKSRRGRRGTQTRVLEADALRYLNSGLMLLQKGELDSAADAFTHSAEADPFAARPHFYLGKIHERRQARFEAMYEYEQAVSLDSSFFAAIKDLAILYQNNGFVNKAVEMWQKALAACPEASMRNTIKEHLVRLL